METWGYEITCPWRDKEWASGYESEDDADMAADEAITELIDEIAQEHPELSDEEIEAGIDKDVRPD